MKMIDMKKPKVSKEEMKKMNSPSLPYENRDRWPWGLRLTFEEDEVEKMPGLEKLKVGEKVDIDALGEATSIRMNESKDNKKRYTIEIQIQKCGVESKTNYDSSFKEATEE